MRKRPLFWSAAGFSAGLLVQQPDLPARCWSGIAATTLVGALCLLAAAGPRRRSLLAAALTLSGMFAAGRAAGQISLQDPPGSLGRLLELHATLFDEGVDLEATLAAPPRLRPEAGELELILTVDRVSLRGVAHPCEGRLRLRASDPAPDSLAAARRGDRVVAFARLHLPRRYENPGAFDYPSWLRARRVDAIGTVKSLRLLTLRPAPASSIRLGLLRGVDRLRAGMLDRVRRSFPDDPESRRAGAVAEALLLGERVGLDPAGAASLQEAGLSHLLAVSGFNVAVLTALLLAAARALKLGDRSASCLAIPALLVYLLLNREESSVERAVVMAVAWLLGRLVWRRADLLNSLGLAALSILGVAPAQVRDPGFQLTFLATLGLIVLAPPLAARVISLRPAASRPTRAAAAALAVTLAAIAMTLPSTRILFHRITPGALAANLVAGPIMAAAFLLALALAPLSLLLEPAASGCASAIVWLVRVVLDVAHLVSQMPGMSYRAPDPPAWQTAGYVVGLCALRCVPAAWRRLRTAAWIAFSAFAILMLLPLDRRAPPEGLRVTMLDVGQGDAFFVETREGGRLLIDAGGSGRHDFDFGERVVAPALWTLGVARLDVLAVTHDDRDHAGGGASIVRSFRPRELWLPAPAAASRAPAMIRLREEARRAGATLRLMSRGDRPGLAGAVVEVLHPGRAVRRGHDPPDNELSLILRVSRQGRAILFMADAGERVERELAGSLGRADLLKVGHHGSRGATSPALLGACAPRLALISAGRANRFGHPHPELLARLEGRGVRVCRTDSGGWAEVELLGPPRRATRLAGGCSGASLSRTAARRSAWE